MNYEEHLFDTPLCVVAFASDGGRSIIPDVPDYEFGNYLATLGCSYVLMRDTPDRWYTQGIEGIGDSWAVAKYIYDLRQTYDKVMTTGVSFGAYGALMYGAMAPADEIVAISPLTAIGAAAEAELEPKWHHRIKSDKSLDLKPLFSMDGHVTNVKIFVSDGEGAELDLWMAERLGINPVTMIRGHSHGGLARWMRDNGFFEELFR
jgi:hypothetical protein